MSEQKKERRPTITVCNSDRMEIARVRPGRTMGLGYEIGSHGVIKYVVGACDVLHKTLSVDQLVMGNRHRLATTRHN